MLRTTNTHNTHTRAFYPEYFGAVAIESNSPHGEESQDQLNQSKQPQETEHHEDECRFMRAVAGINVRVNRCA